MTTITSPALKESGIPWLGQIPDDWSVQAIKHASYIKARVGWKGLTSDEFEITAHAYLVTGTDFRRRFINWSTCYQVSEERYLDDPFIQLRNGDLLVTKDGTIGKLSMVSNLDKPACLNSGIFLVRPFKNYSTRFLYWVLRSRVFEDFIDLTSTGSTILHLYQNVFEQFRFAFPTPETQDGIASYLDRETAQIDDLIAKQERLVELLAEKRQAIITHAVTKGLDPTAPLGPSGVPWLGEVPRHWTMTKFRYFARILGGTAPEQCSPQVSGAYPYIKVSSLNTLDGNQEVSSTDEYIDSEGITCPAGTVLFPKRGAAIFTNKVGVVRTRSAFDTNLMGLELDHVKAHGLFIVHWLRSRTLNELADTSTLPQINNKHIYPLEIALPPLCEQKKILEVLGLRLRAIDVLARKCEVAVSLLQERRSALISAAVTGKIDIRKEAS
ncbi:type I restriction enzyme, S subunit [Arthrobacter sp. 49Tsu3.1M3]|uniref:restriction endonuclease subunit S n=1 Tax=Arthrobacter sp. 49Tsu3.1M3 TaxID=1279029 RepID=UPI0009A60DFD|nr:restriction endonuclease subunit S [Arthrobacter sp. 49Tsu3.1M3]SKB88464.1 type I restriction enzyme, S subunit [Arthrobacter sp. 49Tsu3.1M3]